MEEVKLIFIGNKFYNKSGSVMSSIYTEHGERFDWGFVEVALEEGKEVHIRPASSVELMMFEAELENMLENTKKKK